MRRFLAILLCSLSNICVKWLNTIRWKQSFTQSQWWVIRFKAFKFVSIIVQRWTATIDVSFSSSIIVEVFCSELFLILTSQKSVRKSNQAQALLSELSIILNWLKNIPKFKQLTIIKKFKSMLIQFVSFSFYKNIKIAINQSIEITSKNLKNAISNFAMLRIARTMNAMNNNAFNIFIYYQIKIMM